ncbi:MAG: GMC oxidoreductase [Myxococcota bacterium]
MSDFDVDVIVVGSGFGGSVAALRFVEAGSSVLVLERGDWVSRRTHEVDLDALWIPDKHRFGFNELRPRGENLVPWVGACVGGGSYVYAGTLKRVLSWEGFPRSIQYDDMEPYYDLAATVIEPAAYPDYPPYSEVRATQILSGVAEKLQREHPDLVESFGAIELGIAFAPEDGSPGASFTNKHGASQRYSDPREQSLLGGDIDAKNTLDRNYLHLAQERGATIEALTEVDRVERIEDGWRVTCTRYHPEESWGAQVAAKWLPWVKPRRQTKTFTCRRLVLSAGAVGSTEILLRNRDVHGTLRGLSDTLGSRYTTNGDFISLMLPHKGVGVGWLGFITAMIGAVLWARADASPTSFGLYLMIFGVLAYIFGLMSSKESFDPDIGTTNSDYIRFRGRDGAPQGALVESGRYPTPVRMTIAILLSSFGLWRPRRYAKIIRVTNLLRRFVPPFALLARTWPIPLLKMGRDDVEGTFALDASGDAIIDYPVDDNREFYAWLDSLGKMVADAAGAYWGPNPVFRATKRLEIPHNQGGVPMGDSPAEGVVDHAGRVFGMDDLMVLDGSILPVSPGPNPAFTILAVAERAMEHAVKQLELEGVIRAEEARDSIPVPSSSATSAGANSESVPQAD